MAPGAPAAEKAAKDEVDLVRAAIYFLGILLVGLGAVYYLLSGKKDQYLGAVEYGEKNLKTMAAKYDSVRALVKQYKESGAGEARNETATWLKLRYQQAGIDQIIFVAQAGATRHQDIMSSLRLFASELLPEFKERDIEHQRRREGWLAEPVQAG
jgi:hypothetical protein